jgi:hypothetical protein
VDAVTAVNALGLVYLAQTELIVSDGAYRAHSLTGTDLVDDRFIRAGIRTLAALLTLMWIDMHAKLALGDRIELT